MVEDLAQMEFDGDLPVSITTTQIVKTVLMRDDVVIVIEDESPFPVEENLVSALDGKPVYHTEGNSGIAPIGEQLPLASAIETRLVTPVLRDNRGKDQLKSLLSLRCSSPVAVGYFPR
ncbi:hypothetical protein H6P81_006041 [Aristolochia fimbriata]|uniref:Uncharacterized protein n=1 Tax=Aristolochia fimbriata TaxID=158543 RepID=A0AAV7F044_ARIFI|nr:hypothetical protein H6P81_006041 [Aristolochia fimbriata]